MKFALFGNHYQAEKSIFVLRLLDLLEHSGDCFIIEKDFYAFLKETQSADIHSGSVIDHSSFSADMVLSIGGDGTFLNAARHVGARQIPILGINGGRLGFLSEISPDEMEEMLTLIHKGNYEIEERSLLQADLQEGHISGYPVGLNEVAVLKHDTSSMITIHVTVGDEPLVTYQADGLIVSTPTGSTGYSLSVGGPIVSPDADVFLLSPVAPHSLTARPLVLRDDKPLTLKVESRSRNFLLSIDGQSRSYDEKTVIRLQKAPYHLQMVKRVGHTFFQTLQQKMMWGMDTRN